MCHSSTNFFGKLCEKLNSRFGNKDPPQTVRGKLQELRQDDLSLEKFGELVINGYPGAAENMKEATDTFLKGVTKRRAALSAIDKKQQTLDIVKSAIITRINSCHRSKWT